MEQTTLYYRQGSSDKTYQAIIESKDSGFVVNIIYGRRGATQQTGTKTSKPVSYAQAKAIYDKLIREKTAKGYTPGEAGTPYQHTGKESQTTGIHCQLLNAVEEDELNRLIDDPAYLMQEKFDGRRLLIQKQGDVVAGINRLGLNVGLSSPLVTSASHCSLDFILDGEAVGDDLHAFDILQIGMDDLRSLPCHERHTRLTALLESFQHPHIRCVDVVTLPDGKRILLKEIKARNGEGVVFKRADAAYSAGRPASGGSQLKFKFYETASFIVGSINSKRSISLLLNDGAGMAPAGNVTIPPNREFPEQGQIVECRYLYAFKESGSVFQPVFLGVRNDIPADECTVGQLKFKAPAAETIPG